MRASNGTYALLDPLSSYNVNARLSQTSSAIDVAQVKIAPLIVNGLAHSMTSIRYRATPVNAE